MSCYNFRCFTYPKKTFELIKESWNEGLIQVKNNQKFLNKNCEKIRNNTEILDENLTYEKKWNRRERRLIRTYNYVNLTEKAPRRKYSWGVDEIWKNYITTLVEVTRIITTFDTKTKKSKTTIEKSFYLSTKEFSAKKFQKFVRWHWWIENSNHWVRDETLWEDKSRIRVKPEIFCILRSFALNILRAKWIKNVKNSIYRNSLNIYKFFKEYWDFI